MVGGSFRDQSASLYRGAPNRKRYTILVADIETRFWWPSPSGDPQNGPSQQRKGLKCFALYVRFGPTAAVHACCDENTSQHFLCCRSPGPLTRSTGISSRSFLRHSTAATHDARTQMKSRGRERLFLTHMLCVGSVKEKQSIISFSMPEKKAASDAKNVRWAASADMISFKLFL